MLGVGSGGPTGPWLAAAAEPPTTAVNVTPRTGSASRRPRLTERQAWAVLTAVDGLGPVGFGALLREFGSALGILETALEAGAVARLVAAGVNDDRDTFDAGVARSIVAVAESPLPTLRRVEVPGVEIITTEDRAYPRRLLSIELPPHVLFVRGAVEAMSTPHAVAVVGTRRPTEEGRALAARIGGALGEVGATVVSGLAVGIDGASHAAAMAQGGPTVAVLGSGHSRLYPRAHARLADRIVAEGGAVVSELVPDVHPSAHSFPRRNRLISGLADATVVVEAGSRSGALITAGWALEQGRALFMVPGAIDAPQSAGCLQWLHQYPGQARLVPSVPQLVHDLGVLDDPAAGRRPSLKAELVELGTTARAVALELVGGRGTVDELVAATGHSVATALGALTILEMRGLATSAYGRYRPAGRLAAAADEVLRRR
ncbi:MAG: DNA-processing protein DprA [Chloroflexota bacterium]